MKRLFLALGVSVLVGFAFSAASAVADSGGGFAAGGFQGVLGSGNQTVAFSAQSTAVGVVGEVSETFVVQDELSILRGDVVCLAASGKRAAIGYVVRQSTGVFVPSMPVGSTQMLIVKDDAAGDTFAFASLSDCATAVTIDPIFPIKNGNIIVGT